MLERVRRKWDGPNYLTDKGAAASLAANINDYWHQRGFEHVSAWIEPMRSKGADMWSIRSNLINGLPAS